MSARENDEQAAAKKALRRAVLAARQALDEVTIRQKSAAICRRLMALPVWEKARNLMAYVDFRGEVATDLLIRQALAGGKAVAAPVTVISEKKLIPVVLERYPEDLREGAWGIREPDAQRGRRLLPEELDLVIVPGVAYDIKGNRLGYGGGFYDRFLPRTRPDTVFVAPAYELQIREHCYPGPHDCPVDIIVTEERVIHTGARGKRPGGQDQGR